MRRTILALLLALELGGVAAATELDPRAAVFRLPDQIPWGPVTRSGNQRAVLVGDPGRPGLYVVMVRWLPGNMSRPHSHPNDRFIIVLSGTWWMGSGARFDPDGTVPVPAGTLVTHFGGQVHYDGGHKPKEEPVVLLVVGEGPATSAPAEAR